MNAAAKMLGQEASFAENWLGLSFTRNGLLLVTLVAAVLFSALSVIYFKNTQRSYYSELQSMDRQANHLRLEWGQLLLEQSTWATSARVQAVAQEHLGMVMPSAKDITIINSQ